MCGRLAATLTIEETGWRRETRGPRERAPGEMTRARSTGRAEKALTSGKGLPSRYSQRMAAAWETTQPGAFTRIDWSVPASTVSESSISSPQVGWR